MAANVFVVKDKKRSFLGNKQKYRKELPSRLKDACELKDELVDSLPENLNKIADIQGKFKYVRIKIESQLRERAIITSYDLYTFLEPLLENINLNDPIVLKELFILLKEYPNFAAALAYDLSPDNETSPKIDHLSLENDEKLKKSRDNVITKLKQSGEFLYQFFNTFKKDVDRLSPKSLIDIAKQNGGAAAAICSFKQLQKKLLNQSDLNIEDLQPLVEKVGDNLQRKQQVMDFIFKYAKKHQTDIKNILLIVSALFDEKDERKKSQNLRLGKLVTAYSDVCAQQFKLLASQENKSLENKTENKKEFVKLKNLPVKSSVFKKIGPPPSDLLALLTKVEVEKQDTEKQGIKYICKTKDEDYGPICKFIKDICAENDAFRNHIVEVYLNKEPPQIPDEVACLLVDNSSLLEQLTKRSWKEFLWDRKSYATRMEKLKRSSEIIGSKLAGNQFSFEIKHEPEVLQPVLAAVESQVNPQNLLLPEAEHHSEAEEGLSLARDASSPKSMVTEGAVYTPDAPTPPASQSNISFGKTVYTPDAPTPPAASRSSISTGKAVYTPDASTPPRTIQSVVFSEKNIYSPSDSTPEGTPQKFSTEVRKEGEQEEDDKNIPEISSSSRDASYNLVIQDAEKTAQLAFATAFLQARERNRKTSNYSTSTEGAAQSSHYFASNQTPVATSFYDPDAPSPLESAEPAVGNVYNPDAQSPTEPTVPAGENAYNPDAPSPLESAEPAVGNVYNPDAPSPTEPTVPVGENVYNPDALSPTETTVPAGGNFYNPDVPSPVESVASANSAKNTQDQDVLPGVSAALGKDFLNRSPVKGSPERNTGKFRLQAFDYGTPRKQKSSDNGSSRNQNDGTAPDSDVRKKLFELP